MIEFILQIILPGITAAVFIRWMHKRDEKILQELERTLENKEESHTYVIEEDGVACVLVDIFFILATIGFIGVIIQNGWDWGYMLVVGLPLELFGAYAFALGNIWKIWINGEQIIYRSIIGIKHYYTFDDITSYTERSNGAIIVYANGKRAFYLNENLFGKSILVGQMKNRKIPNDIDGMTFANFTLKPRKVYTIVSLSCVLFCGWGAIGLYKQTGPDNILFYLMAICTAISFLILLDLQLDRFTVEGKNVTRKRGLITKHFSLEEVDYIKRKNNLFRENIEFYIDDKKVTHVWALNNPITLLEQKLATEGIKTQKGKKEPKKQKNR